MIDETQPIKTGQEGVLKETISVKDDMGASREAAKKEEAASSALLDGEETTRETPSELAEREVKEGIADLKLKIVRAKERLAENSDKLHVRLWPTAEALANSGPDVAGTVAIATTSSREVNRKINGDWEQTEKPINDTRRSAYISAIDHVADTSQMFFLTKFEENFGKLPPDKRKRYQDLFNELQNMKKGLSYGIIRHEVDEGFLRRKYENMTRDIKSFCDKLSREISKLEN